MDKKISVVYTFSSLIDDIIKDDNDYNSDLSNNEFNKFNKSSINEINMSSISSMEQINNEIIDLFDEESSKRLLILKFGEEDLNIINDIYYLISDIIESSKSKVFLENNLRLYLLFICNQN